MGARIFVEANNFAGANKVVFSVEAFDKLHLPAGRMQNRRQTDLCRPRPGR